MDDSDPFGMGPPPTLSEPEPAGGDAFGLSDAAPPATEDLPTFGEAAMPAMGDGMGDMGGMGGMGDMGGMGGMGGMDGGMASMGNEFMAPPGGEMGPVAKWRIEQQERVSAKATEEAAAVSAKIAEAQAALQKFYAERTETNAKRASENRAKEAEYVQSRDAAMIADSWDSVCKLVDLKEKAGAEVDLSRMRKLLIQLKAA